MEIKIDSFEDLIHIIENNEFDKKELELLIWHSLNSIAFFESKADLIISLNEYWSKWKNANEKPIFIGLESLDVIPFDKMLENSVFKNEIDKIEAKY
ncbi:MAG: hypothetical protein GZ087_00385 [Flavobacterium sp.]|nr:hypothetical protein [Flavobacterium sp.]